MMRDELKKRISGTIVTIPTCFDQDYRLDLARQAELTKWCRNRLAPYKVPQYIEFRDMLPKSKVGKLLRREVREEERRKRAKGERHIKV